MRWQETGREEGISIEWESITLHAISSEPVKCIYIMLDVHIDYPPSQGNGQLNNGNDEEMAQDNEEDDDDEGTCEGKHTDDTHTHTYVRHIFFFMHFFLFHQR